MQKVKKIKTFIGIFYLIIISLFLIFFFTKFSLDEVSSYKFIQSNRDYFSSLKETNLIALSLVFFLGTIIFVFMLGFGSPVALLGGFIFGKWLGTIIVVTGLTVGAATLYTFSNFFFKDFIRNKFLFKYKNLDAVFKKNEFTYFLLFRLVGGIPFQIANILPVLFNINIKNYLLGTFIGIMPSIYIVVSLGSGIESIIHQNETVPNISSLIFLPEIYLPILGLILLILVAFVIKKLFLKFKN